MTWAERVKEIAVSDRVKLSSAFLETFSPHTDDRARARGTVTAIKEWRGEKIATVDWDRPDVPEIVGVANLSRVTARDKVGG